MFSLWRKARRENSAASRLLGSTSLRFALHGWQRRYLPSRTGAAHQEIRIQRIVELFNASNRHLPHKHPLAQHQHIFISLFYKRNYSPLR
ncbi:hypothetical protein [Thiolapillus sp.]|uniref:hypothetical protein n=1 Tax=Thiolapillus sp. TaxID=2017437 RepID=UPI0025F19E3E|nr:hypothetical protein [Thiolapillus sp.]